MIKGWCMDEHTKNWIDWGALGVTATTIAGWLPSLAALASLIWTCIRIYEWIKEKQNGNKRSNNLDS